jgi:diacylglycerol kinase (ATP)
MSDLQKPQKPPSPNSRRDQAWKVAPNLFISFRYAGAGLVHTFLTQRNFRVHTAVAIVVLSWSTSLHRPALEIALIGMTIGMVLSLELLNTAIESIVDLTVGKNYHDLAKVAKDCAAAAVLMAAIVAVLVGSVLLLPPTWMLLVDRFGQM